MMTLAFCLASWSAQPVAAQAENTAHAACAQTDSHPYLDWELYPAWSQLTPQQGINDMQLALKCARATLQSICQVPDDAATYDNVFATYETMSKDVDQVDALMHHLSSVMDNPELRAAQEKLLPELSEFSSSITSNEQLWHVIKNAAAQPWVKELSPAKQRFIQQVVDSFKDSGADLSATQKARKAEIEKEMTQLIHDFSKKVLDSTNAWQWVITDKAQLAGMPESWMETAAEAALKQGYGTRENPQWLITLDYPSFGTVLKLCTVEATRRKCWEGTCTIGKGGKNDTAALVARIMTLRQELATLLGFGNYSDLVTARRMVGSSKNALNFVDGMMQKLKPAFDQENAEFLAYVSKCKGEPVTRLNPWDRAFYMARMSRELYDFDPESLRPYQPEDQVRQGMFGIFEHLYDISIKELPSVCLQPGQQKPEGTVEVWHPDTKVFSVTDNKTGAHLGSFYMDLHPRDTKRAGAWVMGIKYGKPAQNGHPHTPHLATLVGNLTPPTSDKPALLSHYDVETLFHEFGHMMHQMLSDTELMAHTGTSVAWDFVELPSQLNENWTWLPEGIARYARHYETGADLPKELMDKLISSRYFMPATDNMGQLCIAKLDLEMHMHYKDRFEGRDLDQATQELLEPWRIPTTVAAPSIMRNLTHCISGGYAGAYYSYKWAEVLAADGFTRFLNEGALNEKTGASYRKEILSQGDSKPAAELYRNFMGRDPNPDALLQSQGLLPQTQLPATK